MTQITTAPKIVFVDGFNTVGKDHFISELKKALPAPVIVTDPRVWLPQFQKSKRYWDFIYRDAEENSAIFQAHLQHLRRLRELIDEAFTSDRILVTNRSFVTALNYNFLPESHNGRDIGGCDQTRREYLEFYRNLIQGPFSDVSTLMVNLDQFHDAPHKYTRQENIAELRRRMHVREPELLMNDFYLDYLIDSYQNPHDEVKALYTHWENANSGSAQEIVQKYFQQVDPHRSTPSGRSTTTNLCQISGAVQ